MTESLKPAITMCELLQKHEMWIVYRTWSVILALFVKQFFHIPLLSLDWAVFWWNIKGIFCAAPEVHYQLHNIGNNVTKFPSTRCFWNELLSIQKRIFTVRPLILYFICHGAKYKIQKYYELIRGYLQFVVFLPSFSLFSFYGSLHIVYKWHKTNHHMG